MECHKTHFFFFFLYLEMHDKHSINIINLVNERKLNSLETNFKFLKSYAPEKILSYFLKIGIEKKLCIYLQILTGLLYLNSFVILEGGLPWSQRGSQKVLSL